MNYNDYLQQGFKFSQEKKLGPALENFEAALKLQPNDEELKQMVEMLKMMIHVKEEENRERANEIQSRLSYIGITDVEDIDDAIERFIKDYKSNPDDDNKSLLATAYYIRGMTFILKGDYAGAVEDYDEAINLSPDYVFALNERCAAYCEIGKYDEAIEDSKKLNKLRPDKYGDEYLARVYARCKRK